MRKLLFLIACFFPITFLNAQTGIGTTAPNASAKLDVYSENKGFLPPRVSLSGVTDQSTIPSPATGLLVYCKGDAGLAAGYYYWNGNAWATIATAGGSGSFAASFVRGSRTATQSVAAGGIVSFSSVDNASGQDISLNTSNGKITLAPGNTYRLIAAVPTFTGGQRPSFMWYNETTSSYIGSASSTYNTGDAASYGAFGVISHVIITPSVSTVLSFRMLSSLNNSSVSIGGNSDFSTTGSYPWFEAQVISGNSPVTGQSVDYGIAKYSGADTGPLGGGGIVSFDATASGNLPWSTNKFTLKANKTYEVESSLAIYQTGGGVGGRFQIYDYTNSVVLANGLFLSQSGVGGNNPSANSPMKGIVTPATDIQVGVRLLDWYGPAGPGIVGSASNVQTSPNASYFMVKQIGSSAIINPWTLSGTNTYNTTGDVGIGTNSPTAKLNINGGGVKINSGLGNTSTRPALNTANIGNYEIRGVGGGGTQIDAQDDGFLRLSAGGGTNTNTQTSIDLSGYSATVPDMNRNIVMRTAGVERFRIDASGNFIIPADATASISTITTKVAGFVSAGSYIQLDNIKATVLVASAYGGLSIAAVSSQFNALISGTFGMYNGSSGGSALNANQLIGTTPTGRLFGWGFPTAGDGSTYIITDNTNKRVYRITLQINYSFNDNFMSIERLL